ncbi:UNVERIFIED_CONTAM: hypothetical protein GTU68_004949, partial [Idotea baltica]|nr:hypothetical protein [Idotea baltica]
IVPNSLPHRNFKADTIQGYKIPANSRIIPCIYAAHHDPEVWEKPEEFYPQHFLNDNGEYRSREELIPFSIGRRSCLGESLARMELFVFFASIIRRYSV